MPGHVRTGMPVPLTVALVRRSEAREISGTSKRAVDLGEWPRSPDRMAIPVADDLYDNYLEELHEEGLIE